MIARWAGDELLFILPGCDIEAANTLMERMLVQLRRLKPAGLSVTVSVGVAELRKEHKDTLNSLFELADKAMYQAKMAGRDCVMSFDEAETVFEEMD
jgi:two-component system cell cycle response regulator